MISGIYKITNKINGKVYIGQSKDINTRMNRHKRTSPSQSSNLLYKDIESFGLRNFSFEVLEECPLDLLDEREVFYIEKYNSFGNGYNLTRGGSGNAGFMNLSPEKLEGLIKDLKTGNQNFMELSEKYDCSDRTVRSINTGETWFKEEEKYPLRKGTSIERLTYCKDCNIQIHPAAKRCMTCSQVAQRTTERPSKEDLIRLISELGFRGVGKLYGVSDNAIKKWCKAYGLPHLKNDLVTLYKGA